MTNDRPTNPDRPSDGAPVAPDQGAIVARLNDLLADRAVQGLSPEETDELHNLAARQELTEDESLDAAAAVADAALSPNREALPRGLRDRLALTSRIFARSARGESLGGVAFGSSITPAQAAQSAPAPRWSLWRGASAWTGWIAAAACLTVALWLNGELKRRGVQGGLFPTPASMAALTSPVEIYQRLMDSGRRDLVVVDVAQRSSESLDGEVEAQLVYDPSGQTTLLKVKGLLANDPSSSRYQAWVQDGSRDDAAPISAGFIDIPHTGATYVMRIDPSLPLGRPVGFALTREPPQGSVMSSPDRIIISGSIYNGPDVGPPQPNGFSEPHSRGRTDGPVETAP
ncbi:MAG: hypothetical protein ACT4PL_02095 [Phycisphaerales bacterium]